MVVIEEADADDVVIEEVTEKNGPSPAEASDGSSPERPSGAGGSAVAPEESTDPEGGETITGEDGDAEDDDAEDEGDVELPEEHEAAIVEVFKEIMDSDEKINVDGAVSGLDKLGIPLTEEEEAAVRENAQGDDVQITFDVFRSLVVEKLQQLEMQDEGDEVEEAPSESSPLPGGNPLDGISGATRALTEQLASISGEVSNLKSQIAGMGENEVEDLGEEEQELQQILDEAFWLTQEEVDAALKAFEKNAKQGRLPTRNLLNVFDAVGEELAEEELVEHEKDVPNLTAVQVMDIVAQRKLEHFLSDEEIDKAQGLFKEAVGEEETLVDGEKITKLFEDMELPLSEEDQEMVKSMTPEDALSFETVINLLCKKRAMADREEREVEGNQLSDEDQRMCKEAFDQLEPDEEGKIEVAKVAGGLSKLGLPLTDEEKAELDNSAKSNNIEKVDFTVFLDVVTQKAREREEAQAEEEEERQRQAKELKEKQRKERMDRSKAKKEPKSRPAPGDANARDPDARNRRDQRDQREQKRQRQEAPPVPEQHEVRSRRAGGGDRAGRKGNEAVSQEELRMYDRARELRRIQQNKGRVQRQFQTCLQIAVCMLLLLVIAFVASAEFRRVVTLTIDGFMGIAPDVGDSMVTEVSEEPV